MSKNKLVKKEDGTLVIEIEYESPKEETKDKIASSIDINDEVKILRETIAKLVKLVPVENIKEFDEYNKLIQDIKGRVQL